VGYIYSALSYGNTMAVGGNLKSVLYHAERDAAPRSCTREVPYPSRFFSEFDEEQLFGVSIRTAFLVDKKTGNATMICASLPERMRCVSKAVATRSGWEAERFVDVRTGHALQYMDKLSPLLAQRIDFMYYDAQKDQLWMSSKGGRPLLKKGKQVLAFNTSAQ